MNIIDNDPDKAAEAIKKLSEKLYNYPLQLYGIPFVDANGEYRNTEDILSDLYEVFEERSKTECEIG